MNYTNSCVGMLRPPPPPTVPNLHGALLSGAHNIARDAAPIASYRNREPSMQDSLRVGDSADARTLTQPLPNGESMPPIPDAIKTFIARGLAALPPRLE